MKPPIKHGTLTGYRQHYRRGEPMCAECVAVQRSYEQKLRDEKRANSGSSPVRPRGEKPECGTTSGYHWHRRHAETPCTDCRAAQNAYQQQRRKGTTITMRVPTLLLTELYLSAPPELQVRLEHEFGTDRMDRAVAEFDAQDQQGAA